MSTTAPDMTKEYTAELKKLKQALTAEERAADKAVLKLVKQRDRNSKAAAKALRQLEKAHKQATANITRGALKRDTALLKEASALSAATTKKAQAIQKRIDVLQGRLR